MDICSKTASSLMREAGDTQLEKILISLLILGLLFSLMVGLCESKGDWLLKEDVGYGCSVAN